MRIAQIAPLFESVPPVGYGGTERVVAGLCHGLTERGHDVTLFAAAGSQAASATLVPCAPSPLRLRMSRQEMIEVAPHVHLRMLADVYRNARDFDVIHSHLDVWTLPFTRLAAVPTVLTMHGRLDRDYMRQSLGQYPGVPLVSISDHQRLAVADLDLDWVATVPNGLALHRYAMAAPAVGDHLAFVGRIHSEKGPAVAVDIARRAGRQLHVAAKIDPLDVGYFRRHIQPLFETNDVMFVGELDEERKPDFYASAAATLFPSDWPEPFGLVMIESMAAGAPVIALRRGSVPEIVIDGVTGYVCDSVPEMIAAVSRVGLLDRDACRRHAMTFSREVMSERYERVYERVVCSGVDDPRAVAASVAT